MDEMSFGNLELAWLAALALGLCLWGVQRVRTAHRRVAKVARGKIAARLFASMDPRRAIATELLVGAALVLVCLAATRPRYGLRETEVANAGIDIAFVVDASRSMMVRDVVPNRLRGAALEISGLLDRLAGGRVALVPFAGIPFVQCPLTTDHEVIRTYLAELKVDDMPVGGSNLGRAIGLAADLLTGESQSQEAALRDNLVPEFKGSKHKAIVVFSDGEDHEGEPIEAAKRAYAQGIRVYTVGVGSSFGDPVPIIGADGSVTGTLKDEQGNPIFSKLDLTKLEAIAAASNAKSFHYANKSIVPTLFATLDALEKAEYRERFKLLGEERYQLLLGPALLLLLLALWPGERRRPVQSAALAAKRLARGGSAALTLLAVAVALVVAGAPARAASPATPASAPPATPTTPPATSTQQGPAETGANTSAAAPTPTRSQVDRRRDPSWLDRENPDVADGRAAHTAGRHGEALQSFQTAQRERPEHAILWYDVGLCHSILGQHPDAALAFGRALSAMVERDPELEADLHFAAGTNQLAWGAAIERAKSADASTNAGAAPGGGPKDPGPPASAGAAPQPSAPSGAAEPTSDDPSEHYRLAVESLQKALISAPERADVRRNLELAVLRAYPPCERRDTAQEPNDQPSMAKPLELSTESRETHFDLRSCPLDRDLFRLALQQGDRLTAKVATTQEADVRAIDPLLGSQSGSARLRLTLLDTAGGATLRGAEAPAPPVQEVQLTVGATDGQLLLDVRNDAGVETPYGLDVRVLPACSRLEEDSEPNDVPAAARPIEVGSPVKLRLCPRNDDHVAVDLVAGQGLLIKASRKVEIGADVFELAILDAGGAELSRGVAKGQEHLARLAFAPETGRYIVRVRGGLDTEADVELTAVILPPCGGRDDPFEDNDQPLTANPMQSEDLQTPIEGLTLCPGDDDWYRVELKEGESVVADLVAPLAETPDVAELAGALTVTIYDAKGEIWGEARGGPLAPGAESLARTTAVLAPPAGTYFVRVTGGGVADPGFPLPPLPPEAQIVVSDLPSPQTGDPSAGSPGMPPPQGGAPPAPGLGPGGITATPLGPGAPPGNPPAGADPSAPAATARKVRRVVVPDGLPAPAVDLQRARIDVGYNLSLRIVPPCPAGNDEREPDNAAGEAKRLEVGQEALMRICKGDNDWIEVQQKAGQSLSVQARYDYAHGPLTLTAFDEAGSAELAKGATHAPPLPGGPASGDDTPAARRGRTALSALALPAPEKDRVVKVQVKAGSPDAENFYFVRIDEPPPPQENPNSKPEDGDDKKDDEQKKDDKGEQDKKDPKSQESGDKDAPDPKQAERDARKQQMQRHDHNPRNLEALEAMRKSPFRNQRPAKDW